MNMTGYTKLFGSIVASTIWREPHTVRIVWITMLAMANKNGIVEASIPGLADLSRVSLDECKEALSALQSPDEYSRTPDNEGRRIEPVDGGWSILNHGKYRAKMGVDERREYLRIKQKEHRDRKKVSTIVNNGQSKSTASTHAEADTKAKEEPAGGAASPPKVRKPSGEHQEFIDAWMQYYEKRNGAPYPFGGRDAKAVKQLLDHFGDPEDAKLFIKAVHKRTKDGYPFENAETLYGIANNLAVLQAALAKKNGGGGHGDGLFLSR